MKCSLPPHKPLTFASFDDYDVHYQKTHVNRCQECRKNFPDEHFLHLHIAENHDPISAAKRDRGEKMYACFLPTCPRPCSTPLKRRLHMIDKHQFPKDYDFFIVNNGIDHRNSMLRNQHRRRSSAMSTNGSGRKRGESSASTMEVVKDGKKNEGLNDEENSEEDEDESEEDESMSIAKKSPLNPAAPVKQALPSPNDESSEEASEEDEEDSEEDSEEEPTKRQPKLKSPPKPAKYSPLKLRGRGGFGRVGQRNTPTSPKAAPTAPSTKSGPKTSDSIDSLTSSMSALQFIPNSVRKARERAKSNAPTAS